MRLIGERNYHAGSHMDPEGLELRRARAVAYAEESRCRRMAQCAAFLAATKYGFPEALNEDDIARLVELNRQKPRYFTNVELPPDSAA